MFAIGDRVKLAIDGSREGVVITILPAVEDMPRYLVFHGAGDTAEYFENQLMRAEEVVQGTKLTLEEFLPSYAASKFSVKSNSSMFSLNAGTIKFIPYQFRPLKKIINADRPRLLIADEVGVGKTVETGIILKEYQKRESIESIAIVCPRELAAKWQLEMRNKFDETFAILSAGELSYCFNELELEGVWPVQYQKCILGLETIRREENIARLQSLSDPAHFDMLILDEAHHVVNEASRSHEVLEYLSENSDVAVFLSATPIQLCSRDLFSLLNLLLPEEFSEPRLFESMAAPNGYINGAIRAIRNPPDEGWQGRARECLEQLEQVNEWSQARFSGSKQIEYWVEKLKQGEGFPTDEERIACLRDLESLHTFAHVINRTKRRDIGEFTLREPITITTAYTPQEWDFYTQVRDFEALIYRMQFGPYTAAMIMATIERLITSCLPAFAQAMDRFINRGFAALSELSDVEDMEIVDQELDADLYATASHLRYLAKSLPEIDSKTEQLISLVRETLNEDGNGKLLVFSFFKNTLHYLHKHVLASGARVALVTGDVPPEERDAIRDRFRLPKEDPNAIDVLLSSEVGCEGLDYEFCSRMVNYDIPWNPMKIEQRIGRIDRFGQKSPKVRIYNFITEGTIEERIFFRCFERLNIFSSTIGDLEGVLGSVESDLTKVAFDLSLNEKQRVIKAQQSIDNAIRDREEQREFEANSRELFLLDVAQEDDSMGYERINQMKLTSWLLAGYFKEEFPASTCTLLDDGTVRLRMSKNDKKDLKVELVSMRRRRKIDGGSRKYTQLDDFLSSDAQAITLRFDGAAEKSDDSLFVGTDHPFVVLALEKLKRNEDVRCDLRSKTEILPAGSYLYAVYRWEEKGYRQFSDIQTVLVNAETFEIVPIEQAEFETVLLNAQDASACNDIDEQVLAQAIFYRQRAAKERLTEVNGDVIRRKLAIIDESYGRKIKRASRFASEVSNAKIKRMRDRQVANLQAAWNENRNDLLERMNPDILVKRLAFGAIEVE